jgi:Zn-finger nucleic acid-binding protein
MKKAEVDEETAMLIDVCPLGHGLWFDGGEVEHTVKQLAASKTDSSDSDSRIINFLGEVFKGSE